MLIIQSSMLHWKKKLSFEWSHNTGLKSNAAKGNLVESPTFPEKIQIENTLLYKFPGAYTGGRLDLD